MVRDESYGRGSHAGTERYIQKEADGHDQAVPLVGSEVQESQCSNTRADARKADVQGHSEEHYVEVARHDENRNGNGHGSREDGNRKPAAPIALSSRAV